jgi:hypothetical protein
MKSSERLLTADDLFGGSQGGKSVCSWRLTCSSMEHLQGRKESSDQRKIKPDSNGPCRNLR